MHTFRRIVSLFLCALMLCAAGGVTAFAEPETVTVRFAVRNNFTGMTFDPVSVEKGASPADAIPRLPQYVTDANGQFYKCGGWFTDPAYTKAYVPSPATGDFTLYALYVKQYMLLLYAVDTAGSELPYPDFSAYITSGGSGYAGNLYDENAEVGVTAAAKEGFRLVEWRYLTEKKPPQEIFAQGDYLSADAVHTVTMHDNMYCVAVFGCAHDSTQTVQENEIPASCETDGSFERVTYCAACGEELSRETVTVEAAGHDYGAWQIVRPASPDAAGEKKRICARCGTVETARIAPLILTSSADGQSGSNLAVTVPYTRRGAVATTFLADENAVFTSSDPKLLRVDENGRVTFTRLDIFRKRATITAASADGSRTAACTVSITFRWWHYILWFLLGFLWF